MYVALFPVGSGSILVVGPLGRRWRFERHDGAVKRGSVPIKMVGSDSMRSSVIITEVPSFAYRLVGVPSKFTETSSHAAADTQDNPDPSLQPPPHPTTTGPIEPSSTCGSWVSYVPFAVH